MLTNMERKNIVHFLVTYFGVEPLQLVHMPDHMLETTYDFAYSRLEMERDF
ncbi:MAG: hypothetical protein GX072_03280 [Lysinibacillus sp.]|nr:hypothetical protein [Lysinibacillus sp.]